MTHPDYTGTNGKPGKSQKEKGRVLEKRKDPLALCPECGTSIYQRPYRCERSGLWSSKRKHDKECWSHGTRQIIE